MFQTIFTCTAVESNPHPRQCMAKANTIKISRHRGGHIVFHIRSRPSAIRFAHRAIFELMIAFTIHNIHQRQIDKSHTHTQTLYTIYSLSRAAFRSRYSPFKRVDLRETDEPALSAKSSVLGDICIYTRAQRGKG